MPEYIVKARQRLQHTASCKPEHSPQQYIESQYGASTQYTKALEELEILNKMETQHLIEVIGTLLYYARVIALCKKLVYTI
jgi:hypothetical protein